MRAKSKGKREQEREVMIVKVVDFGLVRPNPRPFTEVARASWCPIPQAAFNYLHLPFLFLHFL